MSDSNQTPQEDESEELSLELIFSFAHLKGTPLWQIESSKMSYCGVNVLRKALVEFWNTLNTLFVKLLLTQMHYNSKASCVKCNTLKGQKKYIYIISHLPRKILAILEAIFLK
jgi:hypothetical protein